MKVNGCLNSNFGITFICFSTHLWLNIEGKLMVEPNKEQKKSLSKKRKIALTLVIAAIFATSWFGFNAVFTEGQMATWKMISYTENNLRDLYSNATQTELAAWLTDNQMNFTEILMLQSKLMEFTHNRPKYQNVTQVLTNKKGACGEFVWVFGAFCVANNIPFRVIGVGYFVPSVVDHNWAQVNPSHDGETWIHVDVADTCAGYRNGNTTDELWNVTMNNNSYKAKEHYKMVLAYELNQNGEIVITDVTDTFS